MTISERAWKAVRWGAATTLSIVGGVLSAAWGVLAPWLRFRRAQPLTNQPDPGDEAACCQMDLKAQRKNPGIKSCHCKFNTVLYINLAPKYKSHKDSFEEAERQVHLTVRKGHSSGVRPGEDSRPAQSTPSPTPAFPGSGGLATQPPSTKTGKDPRGAVPAPRQGALMARHKAPEPRHIKATNL